MTTYSTSTAATMAGTDTVTAQRFGFVLQGSLGGGPHRLWTGHDVRQLAAAVALLNDSPRGFYSYEDAVRITHGARHAFIRYVVVSHHKGIGCTNEHRAAELVNNALAGGSAARVLCVNDPLSVAVAS